MAYESNLLERSGSLQIFRQLFLQAHGLSETVLPLTQIMHWQVLREKLDVATPHLDSGGTLVHGGYFYNFSTPELDANSVEEMMTKAHHLGVQQILVPTVKDNVNCSLLLAAGFVKIPWFVESVFDLEFGAEIDLRRRVGKKRYQEIFEHWQYAGQKYCWDWHSADSLLENDKIIETVSDLHLKNVHKYNHSVNLYPSAVIRELSRSDLGKHLTVGLRRELSSQKYVQTVICMQDLASKELFVLVHGRDYQHNPAGVNFYMSELYEIYKYAESIGINTIYLGRGNHSLKRTLGANRFNLLNNWIRVSDGVARSELLQLIEVAERKFELEEYVHKNRYFNIIALANKCVVKSTQPFHLENRQKMEKAGYLDLASNIGVIKGDYVAYPCINMKKLKEKYVQFLLSEQKILIQNMDLLFTRGITEAIDLLIRSFCEKDIDRVLVCEPTFPMYRYFSRISGVEVKTLPLQGDDLNRIDLVSAAKIDPKIAFLCSPNNPTGVAVELTHIAELASSIKGLLVVDEAYIEFSDTPSAVQLINQHPNLVVLRTFSKAWGLAGLRVGAVIAHPDVLEVLRRVQGPFTLGTHSASILKKSLNNVDKMRKGVALVRQERSRMTELLIKLKSVKRVFRSDSNFLCVEPVDMESVLSKLNAEKIIVEKAGALQPNHLRIGISHSESNNRVLNAFGSIIS